MKGQGGQTLVIVSVMAVVLIAFVALAIDGGNLYLQRRQMQTAADAGALAAARTWCEDPASDWQAVGEQYCDQNRGDTYPGDCVAEAGTIGPVRVTASSDVSTWFMPILGGGFATIDVSAVAEADCKPISVTGTILPMAVMAPFPESCELQPIASCFVENETVELWDKEDQSLRQACEHDPSLPQCDDASGALGFLNLVSECGGGAHELEAIISDPSCAPTIHIPSWQPAKPGANLQPLADTLRTEICGDIVPVPLYRTKELAPDGQGGNEDHSYLIEGLGMLEVTGICTHAGEGTCDLVKYGELACDNKYRMIRGIFRGMVTEGHYEPGAQDTGAYTVFLVR